MIGRFKPSSKSNDHFEDSRPLLEDDPGKHPSSSQSRVLFSTEDGGSEDEELMSVESSQDSRETSLKDRRKSLRRDEEYTIAPPLRSTIQSREARASNKVSNSRATL